MDYEFETTTGEIIKAHSAPYSSAQIDEMLGRVLNEDVGGGVFWAEYGVTTSAEIEEAYQAGKEVLVKYNQFVARLANRPSATSHTFATPAYPSMNVLNTMRLECSSDKWVRYIVAAEDASKKVQSINADSTDVQYPSAKAVYTYGQSIDTAAKGYAEAAEKAAADYTDEKLKPVSDAASKAEGLALGAYVTPTAAGDIASFDDGAEDVPVKSLVVDIEPVQSLNGYDSPWPPGGGKNLFDIAEAYIGNGQTVSGTTISKVETAYHFDMLNGTTGSSALATKSIMLKPGTYTITAIVTGGSLYIYRVGADGKTGSSDYYLGGLSSTISSVSFTIDAESGITLRYPNQGASTISNLQLEAGSTATAYKPYSNICPISGWTGTKMTRTGKNLLDTTQEVTSEGITFSSDADGYITASPNNTDSRGWSFQASQYKETLLAGTYTLSSKVLKASATSSATMRVYTADGQLLYNADAQKVFSTVGDKTLLTFTIAVETEIGIMAKLYDAQAGFQLELGSTATAYEPYQGVTYDISFPDEAGTVYGGTLDVTTGLLTVDRVMLTLNTANMTEGGEYPGWIDRRLRTIVGPNVNLAYNTYLNVGKIVGVNTLNVGDEKIFLAKAIYGKTLAEWVALALDVQIILPLSTPITYQLTPTEVNTLLGVNNICADTGGVEVSYRADPTKIYEKIMNALLTMTGGD